MQKAEPAQQNAEEWTAQVPEPTGCVVILENDPEPGAMSGRFSFNGANKQVEDQNVSCIVMAVQPLHCLKILSTL